MAIQHSPRNSGCTCTRPKVELGEYLGSGDVACGLAGPAPCVGTGSGGIAEAANRAGSRAAGVVVCLEVPALGVSVAASGAEGLSACGGA